MQALGKRHGKLWRFHLCAGVKGRPFMTAHALFLTFPAWRRPASALSRGTNKPEGVFK